MLEKDAVDLEGLSASSDVSNVNNTEDLMNLLRKKTHSRHTLAKLNFSLNPHTHIGVKMFALNRDVKKPQ